jgi:hypothetical protein
MAKPTKSETVPKTMQSTFDDIVAITDDFSQQHLNEEYAQLIRYATAALCRKRPSPLAKGKSYTWACGITHAIGMVNFLFDPSQTPHISAKELYKAFGVSASTGQAKSKQVRDTLDMMQMDPNWSLPSKIDENPLVWMLSVNGLIVDIRTAPRPIQEEAYAKGLIPYIPADRVEDTSAVGPSDPAKTPKTSRSPKTAAPSTSPEALYTLSVSIIDGPMTEVFVDNNPQVTRTIAIKGGQTLADLHRAIFKAFDREEEHMYEFQVGGQGPNDPDAQRYGLNHPFAAAMGDDDLDGYVDATRICELGLAVNEVFGYWFDFGDDWWHMVEVVAIAEKAPKGKYPKITARIGDSPPQYADFDE